MANVPASAPTPPSASVKVPETAAVVALSGVLPPLASETLVTSSDVAAGVGVVIVSLHPATAASARATIARDILSRICCYLYF